MTFPSTIADVADCAEFQLLAAKSYLEWATAIARAIHISHVHDGGRSAAALSDLAKYLDDSNFGGIDAEIERFQQLQVTPAPQKPMAVKRGAPSIDGPSATIGERLALARAWAGLTQAKLAKIAGVEQTSISMLEAGHTQRTTYLAELARGCGVSADWLAFGPEVST